MRSDPFSTKLREMTELVSVMLYFSFDRGSHSAAFFFSAASVSSNGTILKSLCSADFLFSHVIAEPFYFAFFKDRL